VPLLLEADESEPVLRGYLGQGELFELRAAGRPVGVVLLLREDDEVEIKNIAVRATERGRGVGRGAIEAIAGHAADVGARRLVVGTADVSTGTIAFYRACGFTPAGVRARFFDVYPSPIVEDGRVAHDMVLFERSLVAERG
jgi:ribosomal protein S18 acetylase RimI-like enzyme